MTVQMNYLTGALLRNMGSTLFVPSGVVTIFQGWRVIAASFEVGGRLCAWLAVTGEWWCPWTIPCGISRSGSPPLPLLTRSGPKHVAIITGVLDLIL